MTAVLWSVHCTDGPGAAERRRALRAEHSARLGAAALRPLLYGPLLADDGERQVGSLFVLHAPDRATVQAWVDADPFLSGGVWQDVRINVLRLSDRSPVRIPEEPSLSSSSSSSSSPSPVMDPAR
ncbi:YciI family protein [Streptomyces sp. NPDC058274]|uniref:YciI family protein n=1 Tax=Streptomyces sp. NPDC058274 TaxID=3346416 RepID=UPI0036F01090